MTRHRFFAALAVALFSTSDGFGQEDRKPLLVTAGVVVPMNGPAIEGGGVLIVDGRVRVVGKDAASAPEAKDATKIDFPNGRIYPGLIDAGSFAGVRRDRDETSDPYAAGVRAVDAIDPAHPGFAASLDEGITTIHLALGDRNVFGGTTATVKVSADGALRVLAAEAGARLSLDGASYPPNRAPTTPYGALADLKRGFGKAGEVRDALSASKAPLFVVARLERDVRLLSETAAIFGRKPILVSGVEAAAAFESFEAAVSGVVLEPFGPWASARERADAAKMFGGKTPFAFASTAPLKPPSALRLAAASAVVRGADAERVERALTIDAATLCGAADRVGSLAPGKDGDLCVFTASPADPRARLLLAVQDGRVVKRAEPR